MKNELNRNGKLGVGRTAGARGLGCENKSNIIYDVDVIDGHVSVEDNNITLYFDNHSGFNISSNNACSYIITLSNPIVGEFSYHATSYMDSFGDDGECTRTIFIDVPVSDTPLYDIMPTIKCDINSYSGVLNVWTGSDIEDDYKSIIEQFLLGTSHITIHEIALTGGLN